MIRTVVNRMIPRHPPERAPTPISGRRGLPGKRCLRSPGARQRRHRRFRYGPRATLTAAGVADADEDNPLASEPTQTDRRADRARQGVGARADLGQAGSALTKAECIRVFADKLPGKTAGRPGGPRRARCANTGSVCRPARGRQGGRSRRLSRDIRNCPMAAMSFSWPPSADRSHTPPDQALQFRTAELRHAFARR